MSTPTGDLFYWHDALRAADLGSLVKLLAYTIGGHADKSGHCYPSLTLLAEEMGCSKRAVEKAIPKLEEAGFLYVVRSVGKGRCNRYQMTLPACLPAVRPSGAARDEALRALRDSAPVVEQKANHVRQGSEPGSLKGTPNSERDVPLTTQYLTTQRNTPSADQLETQPVGVGDQRYLTSLREAQRPDTVLPVQWTQMLEILRDAWYLWTPADQERVLAEWPAFQAAGAFAVTVSRLAAAGHAQVVVEHLTRRERPSEPVYEGARSMVGAMMRRLQAAELDARGRTPADTSEMPADIADLLAQITNKTALA